MNGVIYPLFVVLCIIAAVLQQKTSRTNLELAARSNPDFVNFQRRFFVVYFAALFSDWLQGPYVYRLYATYGFESGTIAILYIIGFAASALFGTFTGPLADRFGRKRLCLLFCLLYSICCLTKLSANFYMLAFGRILGGISTSILFSSFESWYIYEHVQHYDFPQEWIMGTFSKTTFWNGFLAIMAGIAANATAEWMNFGPVGPFLLAIPILALCAVLILKNWDENQGNEKGEFSRQCMGGLNRILQEEKILLLGFVQSIFESVMYIFVFLWTPTLDVYSTLLPLGIIFSCFMVCIMIGSSLYELIVSTGKYTSEHTLTWCLIMSGVSMFISFIFAKETEENTMLFIIPLVGFLILEVAVGMYYPGIGFLRSQEVPEAYRAAIMNWFRVPLNVITCGGLLWLQGDKSHKIRSVYFACVVLCLIGLLAKQKFSALRRQAGIIASSPSKQNILPTDD
ncbi:unnamed protein product [Darwinula stevensoni]|uniref:Molybdate-anion transporter n=1 Tax=Darwinula stevensoni TaxID=69355 RepID=A0A7R8X4N9_9CRUS|nr:unnamed protein product [Darwinula stevensoni]CAG0885777.1 unnamed protein product [Darwinula stevensoni]